MPSPLFSVAPLCLRYGLSFLHSSWPHLKRALENMSSSLSYRPLLIQHGGTFASTALKNLLGFDVVNYWQFHMPKVTHKFCEVCLRKLNYKYFGCIRHQKDYLFSHSPKSHFFQVEVPTVDIALQFVFMSLCLDFVISLRFFSVGLSNIRYFSILSFTGWKQFYLSTIQLLEFLGCLHSLSILTINWLVLFWAHHFLMVPFQMQWMAACSHYQHLIQNPLVQCHKFM